MRRGIVLFFSVIVFDPNTMQAAQSQGPDDDEGPAAGLFSLLGVLCQSAASGGPATLPCPHPALDETLLQRHHLRSLAYWAGADAFRDAYRQAALIAAFLKATLDEVGRAFAEAGIAWARFKGADYAWKLYPEPALRPMTDLDLLIERDAAERADAALTALGFRKHDVSLRTHHARTYMRAPHEIIDLHHSVLQPLRKNASIAKVWTRMGPGSGSERHLDAVDRYVLHTAHMARHEFVVALVAYVDAAHLWRLLDDGQRAQARDRLAALRLLRAHRHISSFLQTWTCGNKSPRPRRGWVFPHRAELAAGMHRSRPLQIARKLALFPRDAPALFKGWALTGLDARRRR